MSAAIHIGESDIDALVELTVIRELMIRFGSFSTYVLYYFM